jgi:Protein of unknown function (DUF4256)
MSDPTEANQGLLDAMTVKTLLQKLDVKTLTEVQRLIDGFIAGNVEKIQKVVDLKDETEWPERILTFEQAEKLLTILKPRFDSHMKRHKGIEWSKVKSSLEAKPEALWSLNEMEKAGHEPDVYFSDDKGFDIGTCCKESSEQHRGIVHDKAVEIAEEMGVDLMDKIQYKTQLQVNGKYDLKSWSWLKTDSNTIKDGVAFSGFRREGELKILYVRKTYSLDRNAGRAFRGSLRVLWS